MGCDPALEAEFVASWDDMVAFYENDFLGDPRWEWLAPLRDLLVELQDAGYDRKLRAGQSMYVFVVSRSRAHGLRQDQPSIAMQPNQHKRVIAISGWGTPVTIPLDGELHPQLVERLDELVALPIT